MVTLKSNTAHSLIKLAIDYVLKNGTNREAWGGTIPMNIYDEGSPNDFNREMIEVEPFSICLTNPLARWSDYSDHWAGITLRETEDCLQGYNKGWVTRYSNLYKRFLNKMGFFNYTYGERIWHYPYRMDEFSGKKLKTTIELNQMLKVIKLLKEHPTTRRACISTWYPFTDLGNTYCPCNMIFQLRVVDGMLDWTTVIRSCDVLRGLTENIFMFTLFQEMIAKELKRDMGAYYTVILNGHLYKDMIDKGYHKQNVPDCYEFYTPKPALLESYFPNQLFKLIDSEMFRSTNGTVVSLERLEKYSYWYYWKSALISEFLSVRKQYENALKYANGIENEFLFPVIRRLCKKIPKAIELLPFNKQREYLYATIPNCKTMSKKSRIISQGFKEN